MRPLLVALLCWTALATPVRVLDGDTFDAMVAVWPSYVQSRPVTFPERVRVLGVNAPELKGETRAAAEAAREFTQRWLDGAELRLHVCERDAFGRLLATVHRKADGANLTTDLLNAGHGVKR